MRRVIYYTYGLAGLWIMGGLVLQSIGLVFQWTAYLMGVAYR